MLKPVIEWSKTDARATTPTRGSSQAAGLDLTTYEERTLRPGDRHLFATGVAVSVPEGFVGLVCPRSGLAAKRGLTVLNGPGVADSDYRGEIKVCLVNLGKDPQLIEAGTRIAQLVIVPVNMDPLELKESLDETERGTKGFGSTGDGVDSLPF